MLKRPLPDAGAWAKWKLGENFQNIRFRLVVVSRSNPKAFLLRASEGHCQRGNVTSVVILWFCLIFTRCCDKTLCDENSGETFSRNARQRTENSDLLDGPTMEKADQIRLRDNWSPASKLNWQTTVFEIRGGKECTNMKLGQLEELEGSRSEAAEAKKK